MPQLPTWGTPNGRKISLACEALVRHRGRETGSSARHGRTRRSLGKTMLKLLGRHNSSNVQKAFGSWPS